MMSADKHEAITMGVCESVYVRVECVSLGGMGVSVWVEAKVDVEWKWTWSMDGGGAVFQ